MTIKTFAPAKVNLSLHVTGQDSRGYHLLDSLVVMVDVGDHITVAPSDRLTLDVTGPFAQGVPSDSSNLVIKAARLLHPSKGARITLDKHLPPASGIGGGSSDAAATIRALVRLWGLPMPSVQELTLLGADIPVCMSPFLTRMQGIGDQLDPICPPPDLPIILVNPRVEVPTSLVFSALQCKTNPSMSTGPSHDDPSWLGWLSEQRNDLEQPAISKAPVIASVLEILRNGQGCQLARMSGSGATCFAIMQDIASRDALAVKLSRLYPEWWVATGKTCFQNFI